MIDRASASLNCPRCGLSIRPKGSWLTVEYCPRCMAPARTPVKLFSSTLPAAELSTKGSVPDAGQRGVTAPIPGRSR